MRKFGLILVSLAAAALTACGGGSSSSSFAGTAPGSTTPTQSNIGTVTVLTSSPQLPTDNSKSAAITAIVRDKSNNLVSGSAVSFTASSGALAVTQATTDATGQALATLSTPGDPSNRTITVTATIGSITANVTVAVVGTKLTVSGISSLVQGAKGTYSVSLVDSGGNGISGQAVTIASAKSNTLSAANLTTDSSGHATFTVTASVAGSDTLTATALGLTAQQTLSVSNQNFNLTMPATNANIALNQNQTVQLVWTASGAPQVGKTITFTTTRGTFGSSVATTSTTDGTGTATATISSTTAGPAVITASGTDTSGNSVTSQVSVNFVATTPNSISVQASPSTVPLQGQSTVSAIVRDPQNNLVQGQTVDFQLSDVTGGSISQASAVTDAQGRAQTVYTAGSTSSGSNGVTVTATVRSTVITGVANITVGGQTVFLSFGTGNTISENADKTQFIVPFSVRAIDAGGNPVDGVTVTLTVHSSAAPYYAYWKGLWWVPPGGSNWVQTGTPGSQTNPTACLNEDLNQNGILDATDDDTNSNGKLDPGDVAAVGPGTVVTAIDTASKIDGVASFNVSYPEDHAMWVQATLKATTVVNGTESSTSTTFVLPILAAYISDPKVNPPGVRSPYGQATTCSSPL